MQLWAWDVAWLHHWICFQFYTAWGKLNNSYQLQPNSSLCTQCMHCSVGMIEMKWCCDEIARENKLSLGHGNHQGIANSERSLAKKQCSVVLSAPPVYGACTIPWWMMHRKKMSSITDNLTASDVVCFVACFYRLSQECVHSCLLDEGKAMLVHCIHNTAWMNALIHIYLPYIMCSRGRTIFYVACMC